MTTNKPLNKPTNTNARYTKTDDWVMALLVDPLSKTPMSASEDALLSDYGRCYQRTDGVWDLRLLPEQASVTSASLELWQTGQQDYEAESERAALSDQSADYEKEREGVRPIYAAMPIRGSCLDIGGHQGRLRAFLDPNQLYLSIDPFPNVFQNIEHRSRLLAAYPCLHARVNFLCAMGEHLPIASNSFETVHIRSALDHMYNPTLALLEAFRVLEPGGQLILGVAILGGRRNRIPVLQRSKDLIKLALTQCSIHRWEDHHTWHPTYDELVAILQATGFSIAQTIWQESTDDNVCYVKAMKTEVPGR